MHNMLFRVNRSPEGADGNGGAIPGNDNGSQSSQGGASQGGAQGGGQPSYLERKDFDAFGSSINQKFGEFGKTLDEFRKGMPWLSKGEDKKPQGAPKLSDYPNTAEGIQKYIEDTADHRADQRFEARQKTIDEDRKASDAKAKRSTSLQNHVKRMGEALKRYPDFEHVISRAAAELPDGSNGRPDVLSDVLDSDHSADLQYMLSKNPGDLYALLNAYNQSEKKGYAALSLLENRIKNDTEAASRTRRQARGDVSERVGAEFGSNKDEESKWDDIASETFMGKKRS